MTTTPPLTRAAIARRLTNAGATPSKVIRKKLYDDRTEGFYIEVSKVWSYVTVKQAPGRITVSEHADPTGQKRTNALLGYADVLEAGGYDVRKVPAYGEPTQIDHLEVDLPDQN